MTEEEKPLDEKPIDEKPVEKQPEKKRKSSRRRLYGIIAIVLLVLIIIIIAIPSDDTDYQQGYDIGYAEGQASRDCDCQLAAGLLTTDEWLECNPEETTDDTKSDKWNEGNTQGFFDGAAYDCP